jgi:hypothetical protein
MATLPMMRAQFPEFNSVSDPLVAMMLGAASLELSPAVWGSYGPLGQPMTKADQGQMYLAAHKLASSPWGQNSKAVFPNRFGYHRTTYGEEFLLLQRAVTSGFRVA